jgi:hypothetical protein
LPAPVTTLSPDQQVIKKVSRHLWVSFPVVVCIPRPHQHRLRADDDEGPDLTSAFGFATTLFYLAYIAGLPAYRQHGSAHAAFGTILMIAWGLASTPPVCDQRDPFYSSVSRRHTEAAFSAGMLLRRTVSLRVPGAPMRCS